LITGASAAGSSTSATLWRGGCRVALGVVAFRRLALQHLLEDGIGKIGSAGIDQFAECCLYAARPLWRSCFRQQSIHGCFVAVEGIVADDPGPVAPLNLDKIDLDRRRLHAPAEGCPRSLGEAKEFGVPGAGNHSPRLALCADDDRNRETATENDECDDDPEEGARALTRIV
jgi:hypothetical protein